MHDARTSARGPFASAALVVMLVAACGSGSGSATVAPASPSAPSRTGTTASPTRAAPSSTLPASAPVGAAALSCRQSARRSLLVVGLPDDHATACLRVGERLEVRLPADVAGRWTQVGVIGPALGQPTPGPAAGTTSVTETVATGTGTGRVQGVQGCQGNQGCRTWTLEVHVSG